MNDEAYLILKRNIKIILPTNWFLTTKVYLTTSIMIGTNDS